LNRKVLRNFKFIQEPLAERQPTQAASAQSVHLPRVHSGRNGAVHRVLRRAISAFSSHPGRPVAVPLCAALPQHYPAPLQVDPQRSRQCNTCPALNSASKQQTATEATAVRCCQL